MYQIDAVGPVVSNTMTVGKTSGYVAPWTDGLGNTGIGWPTPYTQPDITYWPYWPTTQTITVKPYQCAGDVHVWGCDHAVKCKCGKATRKPEPKVCPHCKKAHG